MRKWLKNPSDDGAKEPSAFEMAKLIEIRASTDA